ncbi:MAG: hypothetical protein PHO02_06930 [Candidatus Nanoarchaeia archaeon]|nr:hypothetical protein [Candidatus Nanoarchaeia archaeon]
MPEEKKEDLEEICLGHILNFIKKDGEPGEFKAGDLKVLKSLYGWPSYNCDICKCDEMNRQCPYYKPVRVHAYNVIPADEPAKKD